MTTTQLAIVSAVAAEIDRLVVRGHELAHEFPDKPDALSQMTALPHLLSTAAIVLLARPLTRDEVKGIFPRRPIGSQHRCTTTSTNRRAKSCSAR